VAPRLRYGGYHCRVRHNGTRNRFRRCLHSHHCSERRRRVRYQRQKTFISNGIHSDLVILAAKTDTKVSSHKGVSLVCVEGCPRIFTGRKLNKMGLHGQDTAELVFEDCRVPVSNLLGEEGKGFYYIMQKFQVERLIAALMAQAAAEAMLQ